jgi:dUTP pyrophosphatase
MKNIEMSIVMSLSELTGELCTVPHYVHEEDAAMDCYANLTTDKIELLPGELKVIDLGFRIRVPLGHVLWLIPRSGIGKRQIFIPNSPGTIDSGYSDNVKVMLSNQGIDPYTIENNTRVCQMLVVEVPKIHLNVVSELPEIKTTRVGGFGSSGVSSVTGEKWFPKKGTVTV